MTTNKIYVLITMFLITSSASAAYLFSPTFNNDGDNVELLNEQHWHYKVPVEVHNEHTERDDRIVSLSLNITKELGGYGEFDENSVRVRETNDTWYPRWDAVFQEQWLDDDNLEVSWLMNGTTPANTTRYYTVLFDTLRNGEKDEANNVGLFSEDVEEINGVSVEENEDGHLWISGDDYTVKIDVQRGGSRVIKYRDSTRKGYVYDTGWMSWYSDAFNWRTKGAEVNLTAEGPLYAEVEITSGCGNYGYTWSFYPDSMRIRSDNDTHMLSFDTMADNVINTHGTLVWGHGSTEELRMTNEPTKSTPDNVNPGPPDDVNPGPPSNETDDEPSDDDGWLPPGRRYTVHRSITNYFYIVGPEDKERNASAGFWAVTENGLEQTIYCAGEKGLRWTMNGTEAWFGFADYSRTANVTMSYQYPPSVIRHRTIVKMVNPTITNDVHLEGQILFVDGTISVGKILLPGNGNLSMTDMEVYIDGSMMVWWNSTATLESSRIHIIEAEQGGRYLYARGELNILKTRISTDDEHHLRVVLRENSQVHGSTFRNLMNGIEVYSDEVEMTNIDIKNSMGAGIIIGKGYSPHINGGTISNCRYGIVIGSEPVNSTYHPPAADFDFSPSNPSVGQTIQFTDETRIFEDDMEIAYWMWDFGDGTTSNEQNPSKSYSSSGKYTVTLTVRGDLNGYMTERSQKEKDVPVGVSTNTVAAFTMSDTNPKTGERVTFTDNSRAADNSYITEWYWEFGDGNTDDSQNTNHYYETPGSYTVRLTVTDDKGRTDTAEKSLTVDARGPVARFTFSPDAPEPGETVQFTDTSYGRDGIDIDRWKWNFGDGSPVETYTTSTDPTHIYDEKGNYRISLRVEDSAGKSHTRRKWIQVGTPPVARISEYKIVADLVQGDDGMWRTEIEFDGSSSEGDITEYKWEFKNFDGTTTEKTGVEVTHVYEHSAPVFGFRFPKLTVTDDAGFTDTTSTRVVFYHPNTIHTYTGLELHNNDIGLRLIREAGDGDDGDLEVGKTITGRNYVNIFDSTIHNNQIGILSEGTHFAIKDTYIFDNDVSVELDGDGDRTLMVPVTGAYDRLPGKLQFDNFRSDLYSSKDGDSWSWIEELWRYGTDPYLTNDQTVETDGDGLSNVDEADVYGTDPLNPDTDGDGVPDGLDLHPFYDALLKLHIRESEERTLLSSTEPLIWSVEEDKWYSGLPQRYTPDPTFDEIGVTLPRNIPDYRATIHSHLEVSVWDYVYGGRSISYDLQYDVETGHITYLDKSEFGMWEPKDDGYVVLYRCDHREVELEMKMFVAPEINSGRQRTLAERHAPVLRFNEGETFFPTRIENFLEQSSLYDGDGMLIEDEVTPKDLADNPDSENYLAIDGGPEEPHDYNVYARVATTRNDWIVIQYWFFYVYDDKPFYATGKPLGKHEGDWEMIQIELTPYGDPLFVGYSQHYGGEWAYWWDIERDDDHPIVYIAKGAHASYLESGGWEITLYYHEDPIITYEEHHYGDGTHLQPIDYNISLIGNQPWLKFEGTWGGDSYSVQGPVSRYSKSHDILSSTPLAYMWIEPVYWEMGLKPW